MRKLTALLLALVLVLSLSISALATEGAAIPPKNGEKYVIGISQPFMGHPIRQAGQVLIERWLEEHGDVAEVIVTDGQLNAQKQIADIEDMITQDVDILLVAAHQSPTLVSVLREVKEAGIPIIPFDRTLTDASVQIGAVLNDDYRAGQIGGELMQEAVGENAKIAIIQGPAGNTIVTLRNNGFLSVVEKMPGWEIVADQVADFQRVQAVDIFEDILQANPELNAVFCHNDEMALGVVQVLESAGKLDDVKVIGVDGQKDALEAIIDGKLYGTARKIVEFPMSLDMAMEYLTTGTIQQPSLFLEAIKIDKSNVNEYYDPEAVF